MKASDIFSQDPSSVFSEYKKVSEYENFTHPVFDSESYSLLVAGAVFSLIIAGIIKALGFFSGLNFFHLWGYTTGIFNALLILLMIAISIEHQRNKPEYLKSKEIISKFENTFIYNHSNFKKLIRQLNWDTIPYTSSCQITKAILERKFSCSEFEILQENYMNNSARLFQKSLKSESDNIYTDDTEIELEPEVDDSQSLQFFGPKSQST